MRSSIRRSLHGVLLAGAAVFWCVVAPTPARAIGGGPISGGQIALSGGLDVGSGMQRPPPPSATPSDAPHTPRRRDKTCCGAALDSRRRGAKKILQFFFRKTEDRAIVYF
jgi:hypothetical protein